MNRLHSRKSNKEMVSGTAKHVAIDVDGGLRLCAVYLFIYFYFFLYTVGRSCFYVFVGPTGFASRIGRDGTCE